MIKHLKKASIAVVCALVASLPVNAEDAKSEGRREGFRVYLGLQVGGTHQTLDGTVVDGVGTGRTSSNITATCYTPVAGPIVGFDYIFASWLLGAQINLDFSNIDHTHRHTDSQVFGGFVRQIKMKTRNGGPLQISARAGAFINEVLLYVRVGWDYRCFNIQVDIPQTLSTADLNKNMSWSGLLAGLGAEFELFKDSKLRLEYGFVTTSFKEESIASAGQPATIIKARPYSSTIKAGLIFYLT